MTDLKGNVLRANATLSKAKIEMKECTVKSLYLKNAWKDISVLFKSLALSYANFGKKHLDEAEMTEKVLITTTDTSDFSVILRAMLKYLTHIGEFYSCQALILVEQFQERYAIFSNQVESLHQAFEQNMQESLESIEKELKKISSEIQILENRITEYATKKKILVYRGRKSENVNSENSLKGVVFSPPLQNSKRDLLIDSTDSVFDKLSYLKNTITRFETDSKVLQKEYIRLIGNNISSIIRLSSILSDFKISASEQFQTETLTSLINYFPSAKSNTSYNEHIFQSDFKIEMLSYLRHTLSRISLTEENFEKEHKNCENTQMFFKGFDVKTASSAVLIIKELGEVFKVHNSYSKLLKQNVITPLDTLIRVQTSLNSSIRISLKKVILNFQRTKEQYLSEHIKETSHSQSIIAKIEKSQQKEIGEMIEDHLAREMVYLSSVKNIIMILYESALIFHRDLNGLHAKILSKSIVEVDENDLIDANSISILKSTSRNHYLKPAEAFSTDEEELIRRFDLEKKELVIASYLCAYLDKILLQGKLYITRDSIFFYSYFNSSTIIFKGTALKLSLGDITATKKKLNFYIFDNSIKLKTKNNSYFFTSFISRDEAFSIISRLLLLRTPQVSALNCPVEFFIETRPVRTNFHSSMQSVKSPFASMFPPHYFTNEVFTPSIELKLSIVEVYQLFFSDKASGFLKTYLEFSEDKVIEIEKWSDSSPGYFEKSSGDWNFTANRKITIKHKMKERLPLVPSHCTLIENQHIYFISENQFIIEADYDVDVPYGDYFKSYLKWTVSGKDTVTITAKYGVVFSKSTIFQGKISREGLKETITTLNEVWAPCALREIEKCQGLEPTDRVLERNTEKKIEKVLEIQWELWGFILILLLVIVKLWKKNWDLEGQLLAFNNK